MSIRLYSKRPDTSIRLYKQATKNTHTTKQPAFIDYTVTIATITYYCASDQAIEYAINQKLPESTSHLNIFLCQKKYMS